MTIDVLDRLNRRFLGWHERLFGHQGPRELRPPDILRRITGEMEAARRKGLDGFVYVPNVYTLQVAVGSDDERQYLRTFLGAEELVNAVASEIEARGYRVKGTLLFTVEEVAPAVLEQRIRVICRFDPGAAVSAPATDTTGNFPAVAPAPLSPPLSSFGDDEEPGTVAAVTSPAVAMLHVNGADGTVRKVVPVPLTGVRIGRSKRENNDVVIENDPQISKRHARIAYEQGRFVLYDEASTNGTLLRGTRIPSAQPVPLNFDDEIRMGETTLRLKQASGDNSARKYPPPVVPPAAPPQSAVVPRPVPLPEVSSPSSAVQYRLIAGDGTVYPLATEMSVGRAITEDLVLVGNGVSTHHARLTQRGVALYVEDLGTPSGTYVNGERIPANFPVALYNEDQVAFGEVLLRVERRP